MGIKFLTAFFLFFSFCIDSFSQDSTVADTVKVWTKGGALGLNGSQVGLKNWVGGGQNSISITGLETFYLNMNRETVKWTNQLDVGFGLLRQGKDNRFYKTDDKLIYLSKVSRNLAKHWSATGLVDFRTQMAPGYKYNTDSTGTIIKDRIISQFLAPGFLITSIGFEFKNDDFYFMLSPTTGKFTFVFNDTLSARGEFGVDPGERVRKEFGAYMNSRYNKAIMKNVTLDTRVSLFSSYKNFGNIDVNWESTLILKVNKYLSTTISTQLIYDDDIDIIRSDKDRAPGPAIQFKESINVGLLYQFDK